MKNKLKISRKNQGRGDIKKIVIATETEVSIIKKQLQFSTFILDCADSLAAEWRLLK